MFTLRPYQQDAIHKLMTSLAIGKNPVCAAPTGCHALGQGILMHDGSIKAVQDIVEGDALLGPDSTPRYVKMLCRGDDEMYDVIPIKGKRWRVNGDHVLTLVRTEQHDPPRHESEIGGVLVDISVRDYLNQSKWFKHLHKLFRVGVTFPEQSESLPLDPYILGVYLGDGNTAYKHGLSITSEKPEIRESFRQFAEKRGMRYAETKNKKVFGIRRLTRFGSKKNPVSEILYSLGFAGMKKECLFIPTKYKVTSRHDRLEILAGLLDTDGHLGNNGYDFISKSNQLASDVAFICRSLGLSSTEPSEKWVKGYELPYFRLSISGNTDIIPCRVGYKQASERRQRKNPLRTGFEIKASGIRESYYGFTLSGDGRYLLDDFTVTHNSGKSILIAELCNRLDGRILVVTHRRELIEQNESVLLRVGGDSVGAYSAGLGRRDLGTRVVFAGVASIYKKMEELQHAGDFKYVLWDEVHHGVTGRDGRTMGDQVLSSCPGAQRIGFSATPYRMPDIPIWGHNGSWFDECIETANISDLIAQGFLAPLTGVMTASPPDLSHVHSRGGEFITSELSQASSEDAVVNAACDEILYLASDRRHILIFCVDRAHALVVAEALRERGCSPDVVLGNTASDERSDILERFKAGEIRHLISVNTLNVGFDSPNVDAIALLRSTQSRSLLIQSIGRGSRLHPSKKDALILDAGGNLERHRPLDGIPKVMRSARLAKEQKEAAERAAKEHADRKARHDAAVARGIDPLGGGDEDASVDLLVMGVKYLLRPAKKYPGRQNLLVSYKCRTPRGSERSVVQFVLLDYPGRAGLEARAWFERRGLVKPELAKRALAMAWKAPVPEVIVVAKQDGWDKVLMEHFGER